MKDLNVCLFGDFRSGKTALVQSYVSDQFPEQYVPTVYDRYKTTVTVEGQAWTLILWDTSGQEDFDSIRPLSYSHADVILVCFSVVSRSSYENVKLKWAPLAEQGLPEAKVVLVGCKTDLRDDAGASRSRRRGDAISEAEGAKLANDIGASRYIDCSALKRTHLKDVMEACCRLAITVQKERPVCQSSCVIL